jgi:hypothetical protein
MPLNLVHAWKKNLLGLDMVEVEFQVGEEIHRRLVNKDNLNALLGDCIVSIDGKFYEVIETNLDKKPPICVLEPKESK